MSLRVWWQAVQPHSFIASLVPVALGAVIAWTSYGAPVNLLLFLMTAAGVLAIHAATNMSNDYIDFKRGVDDLPPELVTPFTGGSRVLPDGLVTEEAHRRVFLILYAIGAIIGVSIALMISNGWVILVLGWIAGPLTLLYTYPPLALQYNGLGELLVGIIFGPILVFGSFFVQAGILEREPLIASVPLGLIVAAFLLINEIPERETDARGGKRTLPARVGLVHSVRIYDAMMVVALLWVLVAAAIGELPLTALMGLLAAPMALKAATVLHRTEGRFPEHLPANGLTIQTALVMGLLLMVGYGLSVLLPI